jgi:biopolymer transport protein ExbB/TolQ
MLTLFIAATVVLAALVVFSLLAVGRAAKKCEERDASIRELTERMSMVELVISKMAGLHVEQARIIKDFSEAVPLIGKMNEIMRAEVAKREKAIKDELASFKTDSIKPN